MWYSHTTEFCLKKAILAQVTKIDEPGGHMLSEVSQSQTDKYCLIPLT